MPRADASTGLHLRAATAARRVADDQRRVAFDDRADDAELAQPAERGSSVSSMPAPVPMISIAVLPATVSSAVSKPRTELALVSWIAMTTAMPSATPSNRGGGADLLAARSGRRMNWRNSSQSRSRTAVLHPQHPRRRGRDIGRMRGEQHRDAHLLVELGEQRQHASRRSRNRGCRSVRRRRAAPADAPARGRWPRAAFRRRTPAAGSASSRCAMPTRSASARGAAIGLLPASCPRAGRAARCCRRWSASAAG